MRVPFFDADPMGVVHHANYLRYFENARIEWFRRRGLTWAIFTGSDLSVAVVESQVFYRSPARFDDLLLLDVTLVELQRLSMKFSYAAHEQSEGRLIVEATTLHACVGSNMKLKKIPASIREALLVPEQAGQREPNG
jgi:acyl-CoA thioester hydrolase